MLRRKQRAARQKLKLPSLRNRMHPSRQRMRAMPSRVRRARARVREQAVNANHEQQTRASRMLLEKQRLKNLMRPLPRKRPRLRIHELKTNKNLGKRVEYVTNICVTCKGIAG